MLTLLEKKTTAVISDASDDVTLSTL